MALSAFRAAETEEAKAEAITLFESVNHKYSALPDFEKIQNPDYACQDYGSHISHYGMMACMQMKEYERAIPLLHTALELRKDLVGQQRNRTADTHLSLGEAYQGINDIENARVHYVTALEVYKNLPDPNPDMVAKTQEKIDLLAKPSLVGKFKATVTISTDLQEEVQVNKNKMANNHQPTNNC